VSRTPLSREAAELSLADYRSRHRGQTHIRKAYAALGDDTTLSRFVKVKGQEPVRQPKQLQLGNLRNRAFEEGRTLFQKTVRDPGSKLLVSGHSNVKIGRDVRKGRLFRGYWIFTLTLEERATCPSTCFHWTTCYGNNMPWARRYRHGPELEAALEEQLGAMMAKVGRNGTAMKGVLVRLHALGDFYSPEYVEFWGRMLAKYEELAVFGYTARRPWDAIGVAINRLKGLHGRRFAVRWSDGLGGDDSTVPILTESDCPPTAFVCPEQTGRSQCCATCGLCWNSTRNVAFVEH
jgi:hypothetical protein